MLDCLSLIPVCTSFDLSFVLLKIFNTEFIISTVGSIIRRQFGGDKSIERGALMCSLSSSLKRIAHVHNVAVVVTNHITSKTNLEGTTTSSAEKSDSRTIPALGPSWSHWINSRLHLSVYEGTRRIFVAKSPGHPELSFNFVITKKGVEIST